MTDTILTDFSIKIHPFIEQLTVEVIFPRNLLSGLFSLCISKVYALMALLQITLQWELFFSQVYECLEIYFSHSKGFL